MAQRWSKDWKARQKSLAEVHRWLYRDVPVLKPWEKCTWFSAITDIRALRVGDGIHDIALDETNVPLEIVRRESWERA